MYLTFSLEKCLPCVLMYMDSCRECFILLINLGKCELYTMTRKTLKRSGEGRSSAEFRDNPIHVALSTLHVIDPLLI